MIAPGAIFSPTFSALILISSPVSCDSAEGDFCINKKGPYAQSHQSMGQHSNFRIMLFNGLRVSLDLADLVHGLLYVFLLISILRKQGRASAPKN